MGSVAMPGAVATGFPSTPATFHRPTTAAFGDAGIPGIAMPPGSVKIVGAAPVGVAVVAGGGAAVGVLATAAVAVGPVAPFCRGSHPGAARTAIDAAVTANNGRERTP